MGDLAVEFWNVVGEKADVTELNVGDVFRLEFGAYRAPKIITKKWEDENGLTQIQIADVPPDVEYPAPTITVIVPTQ